MIFFIMGTAQPFAIPSIEFESRNECVDYVNNPANSDRLAIEVIDQAGFNDNIEAVLCLHKGEIKKRLNAGEKI